MYAHAVLDVGGLRLVLPGCSPVVFHLVPAVPGELACLVFPYHGVDGLMGDIASILLQTSCYLLRRPLFLGQQFPHTPLERVGDSAVAGRAVGTAVGPLLRFHEVITVVLATVAPNLAADSRLTHSNRFCDGFLRTTLLSFHINVVPLCLG